MRIPLVDVRAQYAPLRSELIERLAGVVDSGRFILGENVRSFEEEAASYLGASHAIGVANGTDALILVLDALEIGPGDEVICPSFTFFATAEAVVRRGATPVFCEIDPLTLNLDPIDVAERVTPRTKAIIAVHLFGRPAPVADLPRDIPVIEDAAQAFGATTGGPRVGTLGVAATFSFFPSKNLFALGDAGLVATNDDGLAERIRLLRSHGSTDKKAFALIGYNSRLDEIQAAALRVFLPHLDAWNDARRDAAARYAELGLADLCTLPEDEPGHVYHKYVVRATERDRLASALAAAGIASAAYYARPLHLQPAFADLPYEKGSLPETEQAGVETLALPIWAGMTREQQAHVVDAVRNAAAVGASS